MNFVKHFSRFLISFVSVRVRLLCPPAVSVERFAYPLPYFLFFALVFIVVVVVVAVLGFASCTALVSS
jgi:hypothetical protein